MSLLDSRQAVRLGDLNVTSKTDDFAVESRNIQDKTIHPKYKFPFSYFDVAVLEMDQSVYFTNFIRPICLPTTHTSNVDNHKFDFVTLTGWGKEKLNSIFIDGGL